MGTTNIGNQRISFKFGNALEAKEMSYRFHGGIAGWKGLISGGYVTKVDNTNITVSPLACEVPFQGQQYRIETQSAAAVSGANSTTPRLVLTYTYRRQYINYAEFSFVGSGAPILENQVIIADCVFSGPLMSASFDYSSRHHIEPGAIGDTALPAVLNQMDGLGALWMRDVQNGKLYQVVLSGGAVVVTEKAVAH